MVDRLRTDEPAGGSILDGEHARLRQHVVVRGHRVAVRADGGNGQQVAARNVGRQVDVADDDVATLAVLADDAAACQRRGLRGVAVRERRRVGRVVEDRDGCYPTCRRRSPRSGALPHLPGKRP